MPTIQAVHEKGLTTSEATELQRRFGRNVLPITRKTGLQIFLQQFKSGIVLLLLLAAVISWEVGDLHGTVVIAIIILLNASLGFLQEFRAEQKLYDISNLVQPTAMVKRDGVFMEIPREDVVKGDLVQLTAGAVAPADIELKFAEGLAMDESSISGESYPVEKSVEKDAKVEMGTVVSRGMGEGVVVAIGKQAVLGEIVNLAETGRPTNFEKEIKRLSELCIGVIVIVSLVLFFFRLSTNPQSALSIDFIIFILAIAIGILPETLPLIATVALSTGALKLAKMGVVVRNLSAIRDFGSITVLCSDKTGTLTENQLQVCEKLICDEATYADILAVAHGVHGHIADPFQEALRGIDAVKTPGSVALLHAIPFDAAKRSASFIVRLTPSRTDMPSQPKRADIQNHLPRTLTVTQGAYEVIPGALSTQYDREQIAQWIQLREAKGQRILAFAVSEGSHTKVAAVISFVDPVRQSAWKSLDQAQRLGIVIKMISGDSELVSASVARQLRLIQRDDQVISGFAWEKLSQQQKRERVKTTSVFARFLPTQKYEIIKILQEQGEVVGYIGDGVNDAPSLKLADVGISVSNGTDIAKNSADIILLKRGLSVIIGGVREGRAVFENVSKYLRLTLSENLGNFLSISVLSLFLPYLPMLPIQILFTNLLTDLPHLAIATDTVESDAVRRPRRLSIFALVRFMIFLSFVSSAADLTYFSFFKHLPPSSVQSGWFLFSSFAEIATIFSVRGHGAFFRSSAPSRFLALSSLGVIVVLLGCVFVQPVAHYLKLVALPLPVVAIIVGIVFVYLFCFDFVKQMVYRLWPQSY